MDFIAGGSDVPARVFLAFIATSKLTGQFKHNYLSFERKWSASEMQERSEPAADHVPMPEIPFRAEEQPRSRSASILRSVYQRILGPSPRFHQNIDIEGQNFEPSGLTNSQNVASLNTSTVSYIKTINLTLNGRPLQSLSMESATEKESFAHYFLFAKASGSINTGN